MNKLDNIQRKSINNEDSWQWHLTFTGRRMQHNYYLYYIIDEIMADNPDISGIIEVGTGCGALTTYLGLWGINRDIPVISVDTEDMHNTKIFERLNISYFQMDEFSKDFETIVRKFLCKIKGPVLLICDGGDKVREFNLWSYIVPTKSIIAIHDWTVEATYPAIENTVENCCVHYRKGKWNVMNTQFATFIRKQPFLSIVTRNHPDRSELLKECKNSFKDLDPGAFQHVILHDERGEGIPTANRMLYENKHLVTGKYVFILDDDDRLISGDLIEDVKTISKENDSPGIIFVKMNIMEKAYPSEEVWKKDKLLPGAIGSSCFIMSNSLWQECVDDFRTTETPGDFNFINSAFSKNPTIYWQDKVYSRALGLRRGGNRDG